jgi:hypothetical protein
VLKIIIYDKQHKRINHPERHKVFAVVERLPNEEKKTYKKLVAIGKPKIKTV